MKQKTKKEKDSEIFYYLHSSRNFLASCVKPSAKEYKNLLASHAIGIGALGFLGYTIKFIHILINNVIVGNK